MKAKSGTSDCMSLSSCKMHQSWMTEKSLCNPSTKTLNYKERSNAIHWIYRRVTNKERRETSQKIHWISIYLLFHDFLIQFFVTLIIPNSLCYVSVRFKMFQKLFSIFQICAHLKRRKKRRENKSKWQFFSDNFTFL